MVKILISGYGKMGHMVESVCAEKGVEVAGWSEDIASVEKDVAKECVAIDFTMPSSIRVNYKSLADKFKAVVIGTTGWYDIMDDVKSYFEKSGTPMIWASNFSVGVNAMAVAVEMVSKLLAKSGGYAPYIVEKHHCHKLDAPSGTAITLGKAVEKYIPSPKPSIASVRVGELPGIHTVGFEGAYDRITIEHEAFSRRALAEGAVAAALMTEGLEGVHEFKDLLFD